MSVLEGLIEALLVLALFGVMIYVVSFVISVSSDYAASEQSPSQHCLEADDCQVNRFRGTVEDWLKEKTRLNARRRLDALRSERRAQALDEHAARIAREKARAAESAIENAIERSQYIKTLHDNHDGEGGPGYAVSTWDSAVGLLRGISSLADFEFEAPVIGPGPDGSIDLYWKTPSYKLLANVAPDGQVSFYGDSTGGKSFEATDKIEDVAPSLVYLLRILKGQRG